MEDQTPRGTWRFSLPWGQLEVFADGDPIPESLQGTAAVLAHLENRFRPALLRFQLWPDVAGPYIAVWPPRRRLPDKSTGSDELALTALEGVVLAEIRVLTCFSCAAHFQGVYPDASLPFFGTNLGAHRLISGCPSCGSDFSTSRLSALALLPSETSDVSLGS